MATTMLDNRLDCNSMLQAVLRGSLSGQSEAQTAAFPEDPAEPSCSILAQIDWLRLEHYRRLYELCRVYMPGSEATRTAAWGIQARRQDDVPSDAFDETLAEVAIGLQAPRTSGVGRGSVALKRLRSTGNPIASLMAKAASLLEELAQKAE